MAGSAHHGGLEQELLQSLPGGVIAVDDQDRVIFVSEDVPLLLGWGPELVGKPLLAIIPERLRSRHLQGFTRYVSTGVSRLEGKSVRVPAVHQDGHEVDIDLRIRVFRRPEGSKLAVASVALAPSVIADQLVRIEKAFHRRAYELV